MPAWAGASPLLLRPEDWQRPEERVAGVGMRGAAQMRRWLLCCAYLVIVFDDSARPASCASVSCLQDGELGASRS